MARLSKKERKVKKDWRRNGSATYLQITNGGGLGYSRAETVYCNDLLDRNLIWEDMLQISEEVVVRDPFFSISYHYEDMYGTEENYICHYKYGKCIAVNNYDSLSEMMTSLLH